ncbi:MAG: hypothetical protein PF503_08335 [Desulfobacula sp.]|jgi:hypothetical protein|nr:hypothetical protein [Desulfobacula sp.]
MRNGNINFGRLKFLYWYTVLGAGGFGLGIIFMPEFIRSLLRMPVQDPVTFGITGGVYLAFGLLSILGLKSPLKFVSVLFLQFLYKSIWLIGVILPLLLKGQLQLYGIIITLIFLTYIIADLFSIPFGYLFSSDDKNELTHL